jgi:eukaryotic-like serine/threonine-protein kinase
VSQSAAEQDLQPLDLVAERYQILKFIADGASSAVYEAADLTTGERVAIKLLRDGQDADPDAGSSAERFAAEAEACRRFDSRYLVRLLGTGRLEDRRPYLVMELVRGATLKERLARQRRLPISAVVDLGRELFLALDAVHRAGVVHRDVKPRNIVLVDNEQAPSLKLVDFGISEPLPSERASSVAESAEYAMGTPAYMSVEQLCGGPVDERADIYSAGVVLYELVTGRRPFEAADLETLTRAILYEPVLPPTLHRPTCPPALEELVLRTLERDRRARPNTARMVVEALEGVARVSGRTSGSGWALPPSVPPPRHEAVTGRVPSRPLRVIADHDPR